ncbi:hypothetical protein ACT453_25170, partial [Bacillus sp. D-CC]
MKEVIGKIPITHKLKHKDYGLTDSPSPFFSISSIFLSYILKNGKYIRNDIAYSATAMGFVTPTHIMPPWTLPAPIGAYLATGGDWRAIVLVFINKERYCYIYK